MVTSSTGHAEGGIEAKRSEADGELSRATSVPKAAQATSRMGPPSPAQPARGEAREAQGLRERTEDAKRTSRVPRAPAAAATARCTEEPLDEAVETGGRGESRLLPSRARER